MNQIEIREYDKKTIEYVINDDDKILLEKLKRKQILNITEDLINKKLQIESQSYIGTIKFSDFILIIFPKISIEKIVDLLNYVFDIKLKIFNNDISERFQIHDKKNTLIEIIIHTFVKECQCVLQHGLIKSYVSHENNQTFLRGKLLVNRQIINDSCMNLQFMCEYDEYDSNILENQILLFCLHQCYNITNNMKNKKNILQIAEMFEGVTINKNIISSDFDDISYNQLNDHYIAAHDLSKLIIDGLIMSDDKNSDVSVSSFFIDMNRIFEKFITKLFIDFYPMKCSKQKKSTPFIHGLNVDSTFSIIPDILLEEKNIIKDIIDIKYKYKYVNGDIYQISFYAKYYKKNIAHIILPTIKQTYNQSIRLNNQEFTINIIYINIDDFLNEIHSNFNDKSSINITIKLKKLLTNII